MFVILLLVSFFIVREAFYLLPSLLFTAVYSLISVVNSIWSTITWKMVRVNDVKSSLRTILTNSLKCCAVKTFWFPTSRRSDVLGSKTGYQTWSLRCPWMVYKSWYRVLHGVTHHEHQILVHILHPQPKQPLSDADLDWTACTYKIHTTFIFICTYIHSIIFMGWQLHSHQVFWSSHKLCGSTSIKPGKISKTL